MIKRAWRTALYQFRQWRGNTRIITAFVLTFILCFILSDSYITYAEKYGYSIQFMEAFIWSFGDANNILLLSLLAYVIFSDMPMINTYTPYILVRENRREWLWGQVIYIVVTIIIFMSFVLASTGILTARISYPGNVWSKASVALAYAGKKNEMSVPVSIRTLQMSRPFQTALSVYMLVVLYLVTIIFIMMLFNIIKGHRVGMAASLTFAVFGLLLNPANISKLFNLPEELYYKANVIVGWISPLNHATFHMHSFGYDDLPKMYQSVLIFMVLIIILSVFIDRAFRKYSFSFVGTER